MKTNHDILAGAFPETPQGIDRAIASSKYHSVEIAVDSERKTWYLKGFSGMHGGSTDYDKKKFADGEIPTGTPEGLDCTYQQLIEILNGHLETLIGRTVDDYWLDGIGMDGIVWSVTTENGQTVRSKPMTKSGMWHVTGWLKVHGIPMQWAWEDIGGSR